MLFNLAILWPGIVIAIKRWHDRDKSGWWILIVLIPIVGPIWALVENGFLAGTAGPNRFGPDPLQDRVVSQLACGWRAEHPGARQPAGGRAHCPGGRPVRKPRP